MSNRVSRGPSEVTPFKPQAGDLVTANGTDAGRIWLWTDNSGSRVISLDHGNSLTAKEAEHYTWHPVTCPVTLTPEVRR